MKWLFVVALFLCACDPVWSLSVTVKSPTDMRLEGAVLVLTDCPRQNEHDLGTIAVMTDSAGQARVGGLGTEYPASCAVTVAKPGYATYQSSFVKLCNGDTSDCDRTQEIKVTLDPVPE